MKRNGQGPVRKSIASAANRGSGSKGHAERDSDVAAVHQDIRQWVERPEQRWTHRAIGAPAQAGNDLGGRQLGTMPRQLIDDRARHAATANAQPDKCGRAVQHRVVRMCCPTASDIPARAQARRRQLRPGLQAIQQARNPASLVGDRREHEVTVDGWPPALVGIGLTTTTLVWTIYLVQSRSGERRRQLS